MDDLALRIQTALDYCAKVFHVEGANIEARRHLSALREKKYSWVGTEENALRFAVDNALCYEVFK